MGSTERVTLREVLDPVRERVKVEPGGSYPLLGVYGFGRGTILRDAVSGAEISAAHLYRVSGDQIIYSRLKAFEGAFAIVPPEGDGRYVSNEFPTFDVNPIKALPAYLRVMLAARRVEATDR